jgi:hypothetical protein
VAKSLEKLINTRQPNALVERFIKWALTNYVTAENIETAIQENYDILQISLNHFHLGHPLVSPVFKLALQLFWSEFVETYIADATKIYSVLAEIPNVKEIIDTERGRQYLNACCHSTYESLYNFVWSDYPTIEGTETEA